MPGVVMKIVDPDTGNALPEGAEGVLMVKGPNVMLGYLNNPEKTDEVLQDGWYNTGDIAKIDADGFVFILDRVSRFSKIGGEMVPHMAVEDKICGALGIVGRAVVVTSAPDERKGEQLVVCYTDEAGEADEIRRVVKEIDLPNLWKPHKENYARLEEIPSLGSGKLDLKKIRQIALEFVENRPGPIRRAVDAIKKGL
jgi:acyl-[acyl-carrier-protein]-phospholipid O-acyltransferase/long-chain-fatty-acid--[acyl-carrier-protein] ligase